MFSWTERKSGAPNFDIFTISVTQKIYGNDRSLHLKASFD